MRAAAALVVLVALAARAHAPVPARTLRLQLEQGRLEGLLSLHLPPAAAAVYGAAEDPAVALVPVATAGLRLESDGAALQPKVAEAKARRQPSGAIDAVVLLEIGRAGRTLRIAVEAEPPLPIELLAETGVRLTLEDGPGAPIRGGLSLRPRPGAPCTVRVTSAGSRSTRR